MTFLLIFGLVLWWAGHFFKRALPGPRARLGDAGRGVVALVLLASVVLIVVGYRGMDFISVYYPPSWGVHVNNLLMVIAVVLFGVGSSKSMLREKIRHPMLIGMLLWAIAHLFANGDLSAVLLFGSMAAWAIAEIVVINAQDRDYSPWSGGSQAGNLRLLAISTAVFLAIAGVHTWLGYWPFPVSA